jgi:hypothetical protein
MRAILGTNHQTIMCTIYCQRWIAIEKGLVFYTLFTNGCNGCMLYIKHPKHLVKKSWAESYGNSLWANVFLGNRLSGQMSFWAKVFWANVFLGKCLSGQMSFWADVLWANVVLGKCLWANVVWANVGSPLHI